MPAFTRYALAASSLAALAAAAPALERRQTTCYSGVYMVVARGSEEDPGEGKCQAVADGVTAQVPDSASVAVDYPASIGDPLYWDSVTDGINSAISLVQTYIDACGSSSRVALIGYSQGGNIMTDALAGGVDKPDPLTTDYTQYSMLK